MGRSITQINKLPVSELTDEEIAKAAMYRMEAKSAMLVYLDKNNVPYFVGGHRAEIGKAFHRQLISAWKIRFGKLKLLHS